MSLLGKVFALQAKGPEFDPQSPCKKASMVAQACDSTAQKVETGRSLGTHKPPSLECICVSVHTHGRGRG